MIEVKAYIYKDNLPFEMHTIGHLDENDCFIFLDEKTKKDCLETLKTNFSYRGSTGATLTIPTFREKKDAKSPEEIWRNEEVIRKTAQMVAEDGYILAFNTAWPEVEDGKKHILTYRTEKTEDFDDEDELNHLS